MITNAVSGARKKLAEKFKVIEELNVKYQQVCVLLDMCAIQDNEGAEPLAERGCHLGSGLLVQGSMSWHGLCMPHPNTAHRVKSASTHSEQLIPARGGAT